MSSPTIIHRRQAAIFWLALGQSQASTARKVGVDPSTISRWSREPEFARRLEQTNEDLGLFVTAYAKGVYAASVDVVAEAQTATLKDGRPDWPTRLRAASLIQSLVHARSGIEASHVSELSDAEAAAEIDRLTRELTRPRPPGGRGETGNG